MKNTLVGIIKIVPVGFDVLILTINLLPVVLEDLVDPLEARGWQAGVRIKKDRGNLWSAALDVVAEVSEATASLTNLLFEILLNFSPVFRTLFSNGLDGFGDDLLKLIVVVVVGPRFFPFRGGRSQLIYFSTFSRKQKRSVVSSCSSLSWLGSWRGWP